MHDKSFLMDTHASNPFNAEQQAVIQATGGHYLVLAPPGCGKTAVLAERIAWAISQGVPLSQMACLTFTNRAARSMRERIAQCCNSGEALERLFVGNVHRFCSHFLFEQAIVAEHTAVIDTDTSISIIADSLGEDELKVLAETKHRQRYSQIINLQHLMYQCEHHYPKELMVHRDAMSGQTLRELCLTLGLDYTQDSAINLYHQAHKYVEKPLLLSSGARLLLLSLYAAQKYETYKRENDLLDFEDLLLFTYDAIAVNPPTAAFSWIQIDEVQDLNPLQLAIIDLFTIQSPSTTVVYLGDSQQAIFSFMGAKTDTLNMLRHRCGDDHFYNFYRNYRSPQYLLDVFNTYGQQQLGIEAAMLPTTTNTIARRPGDLLLMEAADSTSEATMVAHAVSQLYSKHPDETIAVVVAFNSDADAVSEALGKLPHFKISGIDFFSTPPVRLLLAHLGVVAMDHDFISWSQLLVGLGVYSTNSVARQMVRQMMQIAMTPADVLCYDSSTYIAEFVRTYEQQDVVVFDTETTGLDVFNDDVVQIAAIRVRQGRVVDQLNLFLHTDKPIPAMLGDVPNPLVAEYALHDHLPPAEGLNLFCQFAKGCAILGHNATYDYQIMEHNMRRYAPSLSMGQLWPSYFDTLKLAHLLHPRQPSYKLRDLLVQLRLEGQNSHLANDDILATLSLMTECYERARSIVGRQLEFISRHRKSFDRLRGLYGDLYHRTMQARYVPCADGSPLCDALRQAYHYYLDLRIIPQLPKLRYLLSYVRNQLSTPASGCSLAEQLACHYTDLTTLKEADLCGSEEMDERIFVSTVHKAKGLEFDTVFIYGAINGRYPSTYATSDEAKNEEARKFYVALSRARRRLVVSYSLQTNTSWGYTFTNHLTPFMKPIIGFFERASIHS